MKRIIDRGDKSGVPIYQHTCASCGCTYEFTADEVTGEWCDSGGHRHWAIPCPNCGYDMIPLHEPTPVRYEPSGEAPAIIWGCWLHKPPVIK